jgi:nucleotide-binding universal stress UspA family protein
MPHATARATLGSVAEQVVRTAPCPVFAVPPEVKVPHWLGGVDPATKIEDYAEDVHAGLIVMASHSRSTFSRIVLGGVTRKLLAHACCPVLTLNARACRQQASVAASACATSPA